MIVKRYKSISHRTTSAIIAEEVIMHGKSDGWSGEVADRVAVAEILAKYNIHYVDEGEWAYRPPKKDKTN